jgi:siroheme synthase-like protein
MACPSRRDGRRCPQATGGGAVGLEKAGVAAWGRTVVSPELHEELEVECLRGATNRRPEGMFLVIAATSDRSVNEAVHRDAEARSMLCNVADVPELCNFILPAVHREGPIAVAVSTGGASPALAKRLRSQIAELVGPEHAELARELHAMRPAVKERFETYEERKDYFEDLVRSRLS